MWHLQQNTAKLETDGLCATVDLLFPSRGLRSVHVQGQELPGARLFCLEVEGTTAGSPEVLSDCYVRAADLIAAYDQTGARTVRPEIRWRALQVAGAAAPMGIELIISMQTSLLDSNPSAKLTSRLPAEAVFQLADQQAERFETIQQKTGRAPTEAIVIPSPLVLFRLPGDRWSYAELVDPADCVSGKLTLDRAPAGRLQLAHELFPERLEKGVIRRGRLRGVFLPRGEDQRLAVECFHQLTASAPPLTA